MNHPILGMITRENGQGAGTATVPYGDRTITIRISADEIPYESTVSLASSVVENLPTIDAKAKQVAASSLTQGYNNGWNEYDEVQEDGTLKTVTNPKLTPEEFVGKLTLLDVNVTGNMLDFFYDDENMFWGHSVVVHSMDGIAFSDTYAEIFG